MSQNSGRFQKGQSGNPGGKTRVERTLANRLRETSERAAFGDIPFKNIMARFVWEAVVNGHVDLIGGKRMELSGRDWVELVKWLNTHVDGTLHMQGTPDVLVEVPSPLPAGVTAFPPVDPDNDDIPDDRENTRLTVY